MCTIQNIRHCCHCSIIMCTIYIDMPSSSAFIYVGKASSPPCEESKQQSKVVMIVSGLGNTVTSLG